MTNREQQLAVISASTRVGSTCASPGNVLLGEIARLSSTSLESLKKDKDGFAVIGDHAAIRYQGLSWYSLADQQFIKPGTEVIYFSSPSVPTLNDRPTIIAQGNPAVMLGSEKFVFAAPAPIDGTLRKYWDTKHNEQELARLSLRKLMSQGFELDHMLTMVLRSTLGGGDDTLILEEGAHDTHHERSNAIDAVKRNFVGGTAKRAIGQLNNKSDWLLLPHENGELQSPSVKPLTEEQSILVLSSGLAVASHALLRTIGADNPTLKTPKEDILISKVGDILVDQLLSLPDQTGKTAGEISSALTDRIKTSYV